MFLVKDGFLKFTFEVQKPVLLPDMRFMFLIYVFLIEMNVYNELNVVLSLNWRRAVPDNQALHISGQMNNSNFIILLQL